MNFAGIERFKLGSPNKILPILQQPGMVVMVVDWILSVQEVWGE